VLLELGFIPEEAFTELAKDETLTAILILQLV